MIVLRAAGAFPCPPTGFRLSNVISARGRGAVAQLGERLNGIQEVAGSTPVSSIQMRRGLHRTRVALSMARETFPDVRVGVRALYL